MPAKKTNKLYVSQSRVGTWRLCHYKHYLRYVKNLRARRTSRPLAFGKIAHRVIEADANKKNFVRELTAIEKEAGKLFRVEREELDEVLDSARVIMTEYFDYWKENKTGALEYVQVNKKYSEILFEVEVERGIIATGYIDAFANYRDFFCVVEHKSSKNPPPNEDHRWRNIQYVLYIKIAELAGMQKPEGTVWDYIRSKQPTKPQLKKDGTLSERAIDTLPSVVVAALKEYDLRLSDHRLLLETAKHNRNNWFQRTYTPANKNVIEEIFSDFVESAEQIRDHGEMRDRNVGKHCDWCEFEPICRAEFQRLDKAWILKKEFEEREDRPELDPDISD